MSWQYNVGETRTCGRRKLPWQRLYRSMSRANVKSVEDRSENQHDGTVFPYTRAVLILAARSVLLIYRPEIEIRMTDNGRSCHNLRKLFDRPLPINPDLGSKIEN